MTTPEALAQIDPDSGLAPNETVCPIHHLTYHAPLGACPEQDDH